MNEIKNRMEIIFLYDVKDANPNGDPDNNNQPRMDSEGYNLVTDVRLKRTIRDHWNNTDNQILIKRVENVTSGIKTMGELVIDGLALDEKSLDRSDIREKAIEKYIDVRSFGAAITLKGANVSITGPVQFGIGRSLNKPNIINHTITTTFASTKGKESGTFGETQMVDYSLISFPGIVSETTAKETKLSEKDLKLLWEGLWDGTKNLNTRSKFNHNPRLLLVIVSKDEEFQIGGLNRRFKLLMEEDQKLLSEKDVIIDVTDFIHRLTEFKNSILRIDLKEDSLIKFNLNDKISSLKEILSSQGFEVQDL